MGFLYNGDVSFPGVLFDYGASFNGVAVSPRRTMSSRCGSPFIKARVSIVFVFSFSSVLVASLGYGIPLCVHAWAGHHLFSRCSVLGAYPRDSS